MFRDLDLGFRGPREGQLSLSGAFSCCFAEGVLCTTCTQTIDSECAMATAPSTTAVATSTDRRQDSYSYGLLLLPVAPTTKF